MTFVSRSAFDASLVEAAVNTRNVILLDGCPVRQVEESGRGVTLRCDGEVVEARCLIGATGATGVVARQLGIGPVTRDPVAIDAEVEVSPEVFD